MQGGSKAGFFDDYADVYATAPYSFFAEDAAKKLPGIWSSYGKTPVSMLDLGCGTGILLFALATRFSRVTGVDQSASMLRHAAEKAQEAGAKIEFIQDDMTQFRAQRPYDLVTCLYNTVNYLVNPDDLARALRNMRASVAEDGLLIFDSHPGWFIERAWAGRTFRRTERRGDAEEIVEVWENPYDPERGVLRTTVTVFHRRGSGWTRMREVHPTRGYDAELVVPLLHDCGFTRVDTFADLEMAPVDLEAERIWFVAS